MPWRIVILMFCFSGLAGRVSSQIENVTVRGTYGPASAGSVLRQWRREYGVRFAFDTRALDSLQVNGTFSGEPLLSALGLLLEGSDFDAEVVRRTVLIYRSPEKAAQKMLPQPDPIRNWRALVTDRETGELLPFALVRVRGTALGTVADHEGVAYLPEIPSDTCRLLVSYTGYESAVIAPARSDGLQEIPLRQATTMLPQAEVRERISRVLDASSAPGVQAFTPSDLGVLSTNGETDIFRGVQLLPGVAGTTESSNGLIIRGSDPDQALVQFDDFTIFHLDHFFGAFSAINPDAVKHVRVHKGPCEARLGGRLAGAVVITGKEGNRLRTSARISLGTLSGSALVESPVGRSSSILLAARRSYVDLLATPVFRDLYTTTYRQGVAASSRSGIFSEENAPEFHFQDITTKYTWRGVRGDKVNISGYLGRDNLVHRYRLDQTADGISSRYSDESRWGNSGAGVRWSRERRPGRSWLVTAGASRYASRYFSTDTLLNTLSGIETTRFGNEDFSLSDYNSKAEYHRAGERTEWIAGMSLNGTEVRNRSGVGAPSLVSGFTVFAPHAQVKWTFGRYSFLPGVRINYYDRMERFFPEWRFNFSWSPAGELHFRATAGRVHQFFHRLRPQSLNLNSSDLWLPAGVARLPVTRSDQFSLGALWKRGRWEADVELWYKRNASSFEYLRIYPFLDAPGDSVIIGSGFARGVDVLVAYMGKRTSAWLSYTLSKSINDFPEARLRQVPEWFDQRHELKGFGEHEWRNWKFSLAWFAGTGRPYTPLLGTVSQSFPDGTTADMPVFGPLSSARLPVYHRLDAAISRMFELGSLQNTLTLSVFNLYNRRNVRDLRYLGRRDELGNLTVLEQQVAMSGIIPSVQWQIVW